MSNPTGVRLSEEARELIRALMAETGLKWSTVVEQAIRAYAKKILKKSERGA